MTSLRIPTTIYVYAIAIIIGHGSWAQPVDLTAVGQQDMQIPVDVQMPQDQVVYDQRQNGTENLRVQMSGVTVLLAPAEALLSLAPQDIIDSGGAKPKSSHPSQTKSRLTNLLLGFLGKNHHN
ncbi:Hypothetical protein NTJ_07897 [Nesidiocoris tenuis]|uniref:Uncharacterized protein n=1 Tax=Nesidiocoris tenuis TaxID=355587 RepID=A0ABN7ASQ5_9HEMI|nr:Hypothetical protein NTJ_07897 [Nesidiocoris tenuis]